MTKTREILSFFSETFTEWRDDNPELLAGGLGYFMLFSLAPLLIIGTALLGHFLGKVDTPVLIAKIEPFIGPEAATAAASWLGIAGSQGKAGASVFSVVILWIAASGVFAQLRTVLNLAWKVKVEQKSILRQMYEGGLRRILLVLGVSIFMFLLFVVDTVLAVLNRAAGEYLPILGVIHFWQVISILVSFLLLVLLLGAIFHFVADISLPWRDVWPGAMLTAFLLVIGKTLISMYIGLQSFGTAYGAASSVIVIMVWIYFAAQIFLFGAKFTWRYSNIYGSRMKIPT